MGTGSRDLKVRFVGDAAGLKGTFKEVSAGAAAAGSGLRSSGASADDVGRTFSKTGKIFKSTGKLFKSSGLDAASASASFLGAVPALAGTAGAAGSLLVTAEGLGQTLAGLGPAGFALVAAGAVVAGAAYVVFRDHVNATTKALQLQAEANALVAKSHEDTATAFDAQKQSLTAVRASVLSHQAAMLGLEQANREVTRSEKEAGKGSLEHRQALLSQKQALEQVRTSREDIIRQAGQAIAQTRAGTKAIDDEVDSTHRAANEARQRQQMIRLGLIQGKDAAAATREIEKALKAEAKATSTSAAKHRDNAQRAREMADAIGTATPKAKALHDRLLELARTEVTMAAAIAAMNSLRDAAESAAGGVMHVYDLLRNPPATPSFADSVTGRGPKGKGKGDHAFGENALPSNPSFALARVAVGSSTDLARTEGRGDRRARSAQLAAESGARVPGASEQDIRQAGERAYIEARKATLTTIRGKVNARRKALIGKLKKYDISARAKVKVPGPKTPDKRQAALERRASMKEAERGIRDELETLATTYADAASELRDLGEQVAELDRADEAERAEALQVSTDAAAAAAADAPTTGDFLDAVAAEASLTPGLDDDLAAAQAIENQASRDREAALASGDPRRIAEAARALQQATSNRQQIEALMKNTDAVTANTEQLKQSFGGSVTFDYRGQSEVLGWRTPPSSDRLVGTENL